MTIASFGEFNLPPMTLPIGLLVIFVGFSIAQFLAYHDIRTQKAKKEWEYIRQRRIELVSPYLGEIEKTLQMMRERLRKLTVDASHKIVDNSILEKIHNYVYKEKGLIPYDSRERLKWFLEFTNAMNTFNVGLAEVENSDQEWLELTGKLRTYPKPDAILGDNIKEFIVILNGTYSHWLWNLYKLANDIRELKLGRRELAELTDEEIKTTTKSLNANDASEMHIEKALTEVSKRIQELLCGD